jgi:hypothetical protein
MREGVKAWDWEERLTTWSTSAVQRTILATLDELVKMRELSALRRVEQVDMGT